MPESFVPRPRGTGLWVRDCARGRDAGECWSRGSQILGPLSSSKKRREEGLDTRLQKVLSKSVNKLFSHRLTQVSNKSLKTVYKVVLTTVVLTCCNKTSCTRLTTQGCIVMTVSVLLKQLCNKSDMIDPSV